MKMRSKKGFFHLIFIILGILVFLVAILLIIVAIHYIVTYDFPSLKEIILNIFRRN